MINERDIRRIKRLKEDARLAPAQVKGTIIGQWRIAFSVDMSSSQAQWSFSARLSNINRGSTEDDWGDLGMICAVAGCSPAHSLVPIEETKPTDVIHWAWRELSNGSVEQLTADKTAIRAIQDAIQDKPS